MNFVQKNIKKIFTLITLIFVFQIFFVGYVRAESASTDYAIITEVSKNENEETNIQKVKLEVKSGKYSNSFFDTFFKPPVKNINRELVKGDIVIVQIKTGEIDQKIQSVEIVDFYRVPNVVWAPILLLLLLLVVIIVKYRTKTLIFLTIFISIFISVLAILFLKINSVAVVLVTFAILFSALLYLIYKKLYIAFVGLIVTVSVGIISVALAYITLSLTQVQLSYIYIASSFYNLPYSDYSESFYLAVIIGSLVGGVYVAFHQIQESIKIKVGNIQVSKKELTLKSFRHMIKTYDTVIFPTIGVLLGIMVSLFLYLESKIGIEAALNNDYWVSLSVIFSICLIVWVITVPLCALLCGMILGRVEKHKIITDKTISILE